jgi:glyoxylase-like metal-dependent hydrolase (beta-lactamase superfamily II)
MSIQKMNIKIFTFNPFQENTYILYDETKECAIIDPGCMGEMEQKQLTDFIDNQGLKPKLLINTHCHIDHILGNKFVADKYNLELTAHKKEAPVLEFGKQAAMMYQLDYKISPEIKNYVDEGDIIAFGNTKMEVLFTPGHSPASITLYIKDQDTLIVGDVLFQGSIGRTDLPGGNFETLTRVIKAKLFTLKDETIVYPGHGPSTHIGIEKRTNPFF